MEVKYWVEIAIAFIAAATALSTTLISINYNRQQKLLEVRECEENKKRDEYKSISGGLKVILWIFLEYMYKEAHTRGSITLDELKLVDSVYEEYHALGGNSTATLLHQKLHNLPLKA